jgi:hypothetical protein
VVVADELECVGDAADEVFLFDRGHGVLSAVEEYGPARGGLLRCNAFGVTRALRIAAFSKPRDDPVASEVNRAPKTCACTAGFEFMSRTERVS